MIFESSSLARISASQSSNEKKEGYSLYRCLAQALQMFYERLALEVNARVAGLEVIKPAVVRGVSEVGHRFTFLAADGAKMLGFDIFQEVTEIEVLRSFVKTIDTGATVFLICLSGRPKPAAAAMAKGYGIEILTPAEVGEFFTKRITRQIAMVG